MPDGIYRRDRPGRCRVFRVSRELPESVLGVGSDSGIGPEKECVGERALGGAQRRGTVESVDTGAFRVAGGIWSSDQGTFLRAFGSTGIDSAPAVRMCVTT